MKLLRPTLSLIEMLQEFDVWITPTLGEIRDTERFREEMDAVVGVFERIGNATNQFCSAEDLRPDAISASYVDTAANFESLAALASVLFLVTGKSDNNVKCQLPIYLEHTIGWSTIPILRKKDGTVVATKIPRILDTVRFMNIVVGLQPQPNLQLKVLSEFVKFVLSDEQQVSQLWAIGRSFFSLKTIGKGRDLLTPLVIFQIRGSVAASGGHDPEGILRDRFEEWGLLKGVDFNLNDVIVMEVPGTEIPIVHQVTPEVQALESDDNTIETAILTESTEIDKPPKEREKTRAYDFVLPHKSPGWSPKIFVQSQFYAGDSGSVSHKNVDQTGKSRPAVLRMVPDARFVEYVDGAGYFASLNSDLKKLLSMETTISFIQVRSATVRLRRELQDVGFMTPLELQHAILRTNGRTAAVKELLLQEGYGEEEIIRRIEDSQKRALIGTNTDSYTVTGPVRDTARRYLLLDTICIYGKRFDAGQDLKGHILVPGYGPFFGMELTRLAEDISTVAPGLVDDWAGGPGVILRDVEWLSKQGFVMMGR